MIHVDDGILAEPAYFLLKDGVMRSEAFRGWWDAEHKFLFTHKLFLYVGALFIQLFGWSIATVKSVSVMYAVLLSLTWIAVFRYFRLSKDLLLLFLLLLFTNAHIFEFTFVFRPEVSVAFCGSLCMYFLVRYINENRNYFLIFAGLAACLAVGHHLNGVIIPGAGCILLLTKKKYWQFFVFGCIATLGFSFYFLGVESYADFVMMINQFKHAQDIGAKHGSAWHYVVNVLNEQARYLHSPKEISFTLLMLSSFWFGRKKLWADYRDVLIYTLGACFFLALIAHGKTSKYLIIVIPLLTFLTTVSYVDFFKRYKAAALVVITLFGVARWVTNQEFTFKKDIALAAYEELAGHLPPGSQLLTPEDAVFWGVPKYRLQGFISYQFKAAHKHFEYSHEALAKALDEYQIDGVLFDVPNWDRYKMTENALPKFKYKGTSRDERHWYFERAELIDKGGK